VFDFALSIFMIVCSTTGMAHLKVISFVTGTGDNTIFCIRRMRSKRVIYQ